MLNRRIVLGLALAFLAVHPEAIRASVCAPGETSLCLNQDRFQVQVTWTDFDGNSGVGRAVGLTLDTGYFWFFSQANVELMVKVLDGRALNSHFWVFYGALSSVEYTLTITDVVSGATKSYFNPAGRLASFADTRAFPSAAHVHSEPSPSTSHSWSTAAVAAPGECFTGPSRLCLGSQRFAVEVAWRDFQGGSGTGRAVPLTNDTGYFWFFGESNVELVVKVVDGRELNDHFWLFSGALSSVEYTIKVTDTETGVTKVYANPAGRLASVADTSAFPAGDDPPIVDFFDLPSEVRTNLPAFLVAGSTAPENRVTVAGQAVTPTEKGDFSVPVRLAAGDNRIELRIESAEGERRKAVTVVRDAGLSTAGMALTYVDLEAPNLKGTAVLDARTGIPLGILEAKHVLGISPDGGEIYFQDRSVLSTATHQPTAILRFRREIPGAEFVISADGKRLYSRDEALNRTNNQFAAKLPLTIRMSGVWAKANVPGGPALSPDGAFLFCCNPLRVIDTQTFFLRATPREIYSDYISDMAVTPDGRFLLIAEYSYAAGRVRVYDAASLELLTTATGLGDFSGEIVMSKDGSKAVVGSAGNPQSPNDGGLTVLETATFGKLAETPVQLADNLAITDRDEVLVSSGNRAGVDVFELHPDGQLLRTKTSFLGVGRFILTYNEPKMDDIRKIVFKPPTL